MRLAVLLAASLACVGIGFAKSAALSAHVKDLETLQKIIQYLRGEIVTAASPLPDAFWETGRRMRDPYRDFLQDISEDMRRPDGKTLPAILEENTAVPLAATRLTKAEKEALQEAGHGGADGGCVSVNGVPEKGILFFAFRCTLSASRNARNPAALL